MHPFCIKENNQKGRIIQINHLKTFYIKIIDYKQENLNQHKIFKIAKKL